MMTSRQRDPLDTIVKLELDGPAGSIAPIPVGPEQPAAEIQHKK